MWEAQNVLPKCTLSLGTKLFFTTTVFRGERERERVRGKER